MISYEYSSLFLDDSIDKQLHIYYDNGTGHITNTDLYSEEFTLRESLCSETQLHFGACEAGSVEFKIANSGASLKGKTITVQMVLDGHTESPFTIGVYKVESDKPTADRFGRVVTAYDAMYDVLNADLYSWWNSLPSTFTLKTLRDSLCSYFNITQKSAVLPNDNLTITKPSLESVSGKDVITAICELNGCFGHINRENQLVYLTLGEIIEGLYPRDDLFPEDTLYPREDRIGAVLTKSQYTHAEYEDYVVQKISGVRIYNSKRELIATYKSTNNVYNITNNILADGISAADALTVIQNMYGETCNVWFMPCSVECIGNPCIEAGDSIQLSTSDRVIYMFVLERTLKGIQALKDTYESHGDEYRVDDMNSIANKLQTVSAKAETINASLTATNTVVGSHSSQISGLNTTVSQQGQTINNINGSVTNLNSEVNNINGRVTNINSEITNINSSIVNINGTLTAQNARINGKLDASTVTADYITSKFASSSAAAFPYLNANNIYTNSIRTGSLIMSDEGANRSFSPMTVNGHRVLGWR